MRKLVFEHKSGKAISSVMNKPIFLTLCLLVLFGCKQPNQAPAASPTEDPQTTEKFSIEDPMSDTNLVDNIKLFDLENNPVDLKSYAGKKIFLNFWATWCKPCILEMPSIERAQDLLLEEDYVFLLASDESVARINRFKATHEFQLDFVRLETPFPDIGILSLPTTLIIDQEGKIAYSHIGAQEWDETTSIEKLKNLSWVQE